MLYGPTQYLEVDRCPPQFVAQPTGIPPAWGGQKEARRVLRSSPADKCDSLMMLQKGELLGALKEPEAMLEGKRGVHKGEPFTIKSMKGRCDPSQSTAVPNADQASRSLGARGVPSVSCNWVHVQPA